MITAVRTLTVLPVPGKDAKNFPDSLYFFPLVGAAIGLLVGVVSYLIFRYAGWGELAAAAGVIVSILSTGALHVDGMADVCDSMGGRTREKRLEIMKDSRVGVFGVIGAVVIILLKYIALLRLGGEALITVVPVVFAVSRAAQVGVIAGMPYARAEGTAGAFVDGAGPRHLFAAAALALVFAWFMACQAGLALAAAAILITAWVRIRSRRTLGGVTGDVIGFTNELVETAGLVMAGVIWG